MAWFILMGSLAAFGVCCALWVLFGWHSAGTKGWVAVCWNRAAVKRCCWLRDLGLLRGPIIAVEEAFSEQDLQLMKRTVVGITICSLQGLPDILKMERNTC